MNLHIVDISIIVGYFLAVILIGLWVSRRGGEGFGFLFSGRQIAAVVDAGHFGRVGHVRYQRARC